MAAAGFPVMLRCWAVIDDGAGVPDDAFAGALVLDLVCTIPDAINRQLGMMAPVCLPPHIGTAYLQSPHSRAVN